MASYVITAPNGKKYKVTGQGSKEEALAHLQQQLGAQQPTQISPLPKVDLKAAHNAGIQQEFNNLPEWQKPIVAADDIVSLAGNGLTFGAVPWAAAHIRGAITGNGYEAERAKMNSQLDDARARAGLAGAGAELMGGAKSAIGLAGKGLTFTRVPFAGAPLGLAADGAALGGADAYFNDQDVAQGAAMGGAFGLGGQVLGKVAGKAISPFMTDPQRAKNAAYLASQGVDLTAGQKTGSKALGYLESEMGGGALEDFAQKQGEQFTGAALKNVGSNANRATPEVIDKTFRQIGNQFDALSSRNQLIADPQVAADITQVAVDYGSLVAPSMRSPVIEKTANDVIGLLQQQGRMDGAVYKTLRSRLTTIARQTTEPELKQAAMGMVDALDGGMERSISQYNPKDSGAWRDVRNKYRNMLVIEKAATGAGENTAAGLLSPSQLRNATVVAHGRRNYARGSGDFADLARAGEAVMKPLPNSGTAARLAARGLMGGVGATVGAQDGGGLKGAATGLATGLIAPRLISKALLSKAGRGYLGNQIAGKIPQKTKDAIVRALIGGGTVGLLGNQ